MNETLPRLPSIDAEAIEQHVQLQASLTDALAAAPDEVNRLFRHHQRRVQLEAFAHVQVVDDGSLFSPTRRFLGDKGTHRLAGVSAAFRHVDSRLTMVREGMIAEVIGDDTPTVVHALLESHDPERRETNPGLVRATPTWFKDADVAYRPPDGESCAELLRGAVEVARSAPVAGVVRAGWFAATLMAIHPFVDGNGRSARALFHLLSSAELSHGVDWGSLEMWTKLRRRYVSSLKHGQLGVADGRVADVDVSEFVSFAVDASAAGADLCRQRVEAIGRLWEAPWRATSDDARIVELAIAISSTSTLDELAGLVEGDQTIAVVNELVGRGRVVWDRRRLLRVAEDHGA